MSQWLDVVGLIVCVLVAKPLFVPPIQPCMLRLIGFILKNDDDELEVHPVSAKSTSIRIIENYLLLTSRRVL